MLSITSILFSKSIYKSVSIDKVTSVYDGDTFHVDIKNYPAIIGKNIAIRVKGVDTPEIRGKCKQEKELALKAKQFTKQFLLNAKSIKLKNLQRGKYFKILADVYDGKVSLSKSLIDANLGIVYNGGHKYKDWCK